MITPLMDARYTPLLSPESYGIVDPLTATERAALMALIAARNEVPDTRIEAIDDAIRALLAAYAQ